MRIPRQLTLSITGYFHKMWRGHNREYIFQTADTKLRYLHDLCKTKQKSTDGSVKWYSFCIMGNHTHEVGRLLPDEKESFSSNIVRFGNWMRNAHSRFGAWYNRVNNRQGKVAYDRPKTQEIEDQHGLMREMFYADCNPVRAKMVKHPTHYKKFSTCRFYSYGEVDEITKHIDLPQWYLELGDTPEKRQKKYRQLLDAYMRECELIDDIPILSKGSFIGRTLWVNKRNRELLRLKKSLEPPDVKKLLLN